MAAAEYRGMVDSDNSTKRVFEGSSSALRSSNRSASKIEWLPHAAHREIH